MASNRDGKEERACLLSTPIEGDGVVNFDPDKGNTDYKRNFHDIATMHASGIPLDAWAAEPCPSCLSWCGLLCPPTNALRFMSHDFKTKYARVKVRAQGVSRKHFLIFAAFFLVLNIMHNAAFLSQNFWLWSFESGDSSAYVTMLMPAVVWATLDLALLIPYKLCLRRSPSTQRTWVKLLMCCRGGAVADAMAEESTAQRARNVALNGDDDAESLASGIVPIATGSSDNVSRQRTSSMFRGHHVDRESLAHNVDTPLPRDLEVLDDDHPSRKNYSVFSFWIHDREGILLQFLIGSLDATSGLLSAYSATHVPVILQLMLYASSTMFTYLFHRILYKETALQMSWMLALAFMFLLVGVGCAMVPQIQSGKTWNTYLDIPWLIIFVFSVICPCMYNVLLGRFMNRYKSKVNPEAIKVAALTGDFVVQLFVTLMFFPLDFMPWFGMQPNAQSSWDGFVAGVRCLLECRWTGLYFITYSLGFFGGRILGLFLALYSPTMQGFINQLCAPVTSLLLIVFPALNVYGAPHSLGWSLASFGCLCVSPILYLLENEAKKVEVEAVVESTRQDWLQKHYIPGEDDLEEGNEQPPTEVKAVSTSSTKK